MQEETERRAYEAFYIKKVQKELNRWSQSVVNALSSGVAYTTFQIQGNFLSSNRIKNLLIELYETVGDRWTNRTANQLTRAGIKKLKTKADPLSELTWSSIVDQFFANEGAEKIITITASYEDDIRKLINDTVDAGVKEGFAINKITNNIVKNLEGNEWKLTTNFNANRIARTEVGTALNKARFETVQPYKETTLKYWDALPNARPLHASRSSVTRKNPIPIDQPFEGGLMYPQDPRGAADDVINCRCVLKYVRKE